MCSAHLWFDASHRPGMTTSELARDVYSTRRAGTIANRLRQHCPTRKHLMNASSPNFSRLPRRLVGRLGLEEDAPADGSGRASAGDADLHRPRRARASGQSVDRSRNPHRGRPQRHQIRRPARHRAGRPQLWRHGRHRRRRPRARPRHAADLYRRLRARRRPVAARSQRGWTGSAMQELKNGGEWRVPPNPTPPDTSAADQRMAERAPRAICRSSASRPDSSCRAAR